MKVKRTNAQGFSYLVALDAAEYHLIHACVDGTLELFQSSENPTPEQHAVLTMLKMLSSEMEMNSLVNQHLPV